MGLCVGGMLTKRCVRKFASKTTPTQIPIWAPSSTYPSTSHPPPIHLHTTQPASRLQVALGMEILLDNLLTRLGRGDFVMEPRPSPVLKGSSMTALLQQQREKARRRDGSSQAETQGSGEGSGGGREGSEHGVGQLQNLRSLSLPHNLKDQGKPTSFFVCVCVCVKSTCGGENEYRCG